MGQPAAKQGDQITAVDIHIVLVPAPPGPPVPTPLPHSFVGILDANLSPDVKIMGNQRPETAIRPRPVLTRPLI
jgi:hypothetical protein